MYYYGARYYDPRISIFVSLDPLVEQTFEPYSYTGNNPINFTDPTGMSKEGDYYDKNGNWMINDGKNDGRVYLADENGDVEYLKGVLKEFTFTEWKYDIKDSNFAEYFPTLLEHEGGFVNHPNDPGGATNKGVTINTFKKYSESLLGVKPTVDNLKRLTDSQAAAIYETAYWNKSGAGNISDKQIGWLHFDTYMHGGGAYIRKYYKSIW